MLAITANTQAVPHRDAEPRFLGLFDREDEAKSDRHEDQEAEAAAEHRQARGDADVGAEHGWDHGQRQQPIRVAQHLVPRGLAGCQVVAAVLNARDHLMPPVCSLGIESVV
jgi:hypothetical protein